MSNTIVSVECVSLILSLHRLWVGGERWWNTGTCVLCKSRPLFRVCSFFAHLWANLLLDYKLMFGKKAKRWQKRKIENNLKDFFFFNFVLLPWSTCSILYLYFFNEFFMSIFTFFHLLITYYLFIYCHVFFIYFRALVYISL